MMRREPQLLKNGATSGDQSGRASRLEPWDTAYKMHNLSIMQETKAHIRWEVWVGEWTGLDPEFPDLRWRFNACFDDRKTAEDEGDWYRGNGYAHVDIRCRTTRFQARRHVTTG